jgi:prepilin-type N-terminal cleavage/methylation domain-containing protein
VSAHGEEGFTIVEVMVALVIFSVISTAFMSLMLAVSRGTDTTTAHVRISEEARLGLNRMVRDTREAGWISLAGTSPTDTHNAFTVKIDYNGDGAYTNPASGTAQGSYEIVTYTFDDATDRITVTADGVGTETLVRGVDCIRDETDVCTSDVFSFTSNSLEYDWDLDGVTTLEELNDTACPPNNLTTLDDCNAALVDAELANITSVNFAVSLGAGTRATPYYAEAQLRNRR